MPVYFLQSSSGGPIKIGYSADVPTRLRQLESHYGQPLALLATMDGGREQEAEIHRRFDALRLGRTEQFRPAAELMEFINRPLLVDANPDAVEAMESRQTPGAPVRIGDEAIRWARIASGYTGESMADYITRIVEERAREDANQLHAEAAKVTAKLTPARTPKGPKRGPKS
jgi:hypothetical protein